MWANTKLCYSSAAGRRSREVEDGKIPGESAFKSGKLSTVAVLCLQAGRQTTFHLQELLSAWNRLGRLPLSPLVAQHFENSRCFEAPLRLSASTGWLPSGSD